MRFTAVAALQAQQSVVIDLLRHWSHCNYNNNGIVIQSACEQLVWFQAIKNGFIFRNKRGFFNFYFYAWRATTAVKRVAQKQSKS